MHLKQGLIQVYTGTGKGKTTAALGLALRASGHGLKVCIIQFMKGWPNYGELEGVKHLPGVTLRQFGRAEFVDKDNPDPADIRMAHDALRYAAEVITGGECDILILDEINVALDWGLISLEEVLPLLDARPPKMEMVLTGRNAHPEIVRRADLVTEMLDIKHPYADGVAARRGIEY